MNRPLLVTFVAVITVIIIAGCSKNNVVSPGQSAATTPQTRCTAQVADETNSNAVIYLVQLFNDGTGQPITTATIKFNGLVCPWVTANNDYETASMAALAVGTKVTMTVSAAGLDFSFTGVMPSLSDINTYSLFPSCDSSSSLELMNTTN
jgi:hypothetical protein